jgi:serpin B
MTSMRILAPTATFGFDLLRKEVAAHDGENAFVSPASISVALGMTLNGACGTTKEAMASALGVAYLGDGANLAYANLLSALKGEALGVQLKIANAIWAKGGLNFHEAFLNANKRFFQAAVHTSDFDDPATLAAINQWANDNTNGKIPEILKRIAPDMIMYLLNAVYFKGTWTTKFDKDLTTDLPFQTPGGSRPHPLMFRNGDIRYTRDDNAQVVALPFGSAEKRVSLFVLLPNDGKTVTDVVNSLTQESFYGYFQSLWETEVNLHLPKFEVEYDVTLNDTLKALGMELAFTPNADFTGMLPREDGNVYIGEVKHKTYARVDEEGAEAAAVTSVGMVLECCIVREPINFKVDRPFVAIIADEDTGAVLFAGAINDPQVPKQ